CRPANAHKAEPATTNNMPTRLSMLSRSPFTNPGATRSAIHTLASVNNGAVAITAPTRDTFQCFNASANAPYAMTEFAQQNRSIQNCNLFIFGMTLGDASGSNKILEPKNNSSKICCEPSSPSNRFWANP